jgi:signal transduction histidine kinase/HAMP domain-containing protein
LEAVRATHLTPRQRWLAALLLGVGGYLVNLHPVSLSPGTELLLGGTAGIVAAVVLGPGPGMLAAALAAAHTITLWGHPYAWAIFTLEALVVGWLVHRYHRRPLVGDFIYWAALGVPLLLLTYGQIMGVQGSTAAVIFLKQPLNGLINALAAETLLLIPAVRRVLRVSGAPSLRSALAVVVALSGVVPTLSFGVWSGRREWDRSLESTRDRLLLTSEAHAARLGEYVRLHAGAVRVAAGMAGRRGAWTPAEAQGDLDGLRAQFPAFAGIFLGDSRGRVVAFDASGGVRLGADYSDRDYFRRLRGGGGTVVSDVLLGRGARDAVVAIVHPVMLGDTLAGFVSGALRLRTIPSPRPAPAASDRMRVADGQGTVLFDSHRPYLPGEPPRSVRDSASFAAAVALGGRGTITYRRGRARVPASSEAARMLAGVAPVPGLSWWVWTEEPFVDIQAFVADSYVRLLSLLIGVTLASMALSNALARYMARPLLRIRGASAALGAGDLEARVGPLPGSAPTEVAALGRDFDRMADALAGRTEELELLGEIARSLASTLEPDEVLRRVTEAAARLVAPDGCAIVLVQPGGETLKVDDSAWGLLAATAGSEIPVEGSLIGWVLRTNESALVLDAQDDARVAHGLAQLAGAGSVICAPLAGRSGPLGALTAVRGSDGRQPFSLSDLRLLERLARHAAVAVENSQLLEAAQAASRAKSDFIATMSHELRTPLNAVLGHLELLELEIHGPLTPQQREALGRIDTASRHLRGLIEEVLSFARLEAGRAEAHFQETDVCGLAEEVASVIEPLATRKGLALEVVSCDPPASIPTDPDKVRQILINLAGNAVKFTDEGRVRIEVAPHPDGVALSVADSGPGIRPDEQERLFRPFEQLQSGFSRPHGGTGLGLYLSGQYAALLGGRIDVASEAGSGSTFTLILPPTPPEPETEASHGDTEAQR